MLYQNDVTNATLKPLRVRHCIFQGHGYCQPINAFGFHEGKFGIIERENYNKTKNENAKQPQCPPEKEAAIRDALKYFKMI